MERLELISAGRVRFVSVCMCVLGGLLSIADIFAGSCVLSGAGLLCVSIGGMGFHVSDALFRGEESVK